MKSGLVTRPSFYVMPTKKLIIIGANNFQLPLIKKANDMGLETHVFAWENGAVGKPFAHRFYPVSITEKEKISEISKSIKPDGVISIGSDLASVTVNYVAAQFGLTCNSLLCTNLTTNKLAMRQALSRAGLPCPAFVKSENTDEIISHCGSFPLIVKPADRSGSRGVTRVDTRNELIKAIERARSESFCHEFIAEQFIEGDEFSIEMISWKGEHHFIEITEKETTGAPYFVEKGQHQPAMPDQKLKNSMISIIGSALTALGVEYGASHSEVLVTKNKEIYIVEIGARMGGDYIGSHLVRLSTGYDFVKAVIEVSLGEFFPVIKTHQKYAGVYYFTPKPGKIAGITDNSARYPEIVETEIYCKPGDLIRETRESNDRAACIIYQSDKGKMKFYDKIIDFQII